MAQRKRIPRNDPRLHAGNPKQLDPGELRIERVQQWYRLSPKYRARLERGGMTVHTYSMREIVGDTLTKARGHGDRARENALRRLNRARKRGLPVDSDKLGYGFTAGELDTVAKTYNRATPDYTVAADLIIERAEAEDEYAITGDGNGPHATRMRRVWWGRQPPDAPDRWYYYH